MKSIYQFNLLKDKNSILHGVTKKSKDENFLFSLALHTGEDRDTILLNREKLFNKITQQDNLNNFIFIGANQTHSSNIKIIKKTSSDNFLIVDNCDGLITNQKNTILTILTADCVPILLYDEVKNIVGAVHAGWRGTRDNIIKHCIESMILEFDSNPKDIIASIAPSIGICCYEVGDEVARYFTSYPLALTLKNNKKYNLDLAKINKIQLEEIGVLNKNIELSNICTACEVEDYFSYRKEIGCSGRFMSFIGLKE
jgi:hypothetical protein